MGGGGGIGYYGGAGADNLDGLKDVARDALKSPERPERRRAFISFRHSDLDKVNFLRMQAKNKKSDLNFIDMSLRVPFNSTNADYIKSGIRARIKNASITIVMASDDTHKSKWVNWEIDETAKMGKKVLVIDARKNAKSPLPGAVGSNKSSVKVVPWKIDNVMSAIDDLTQ